MIFCGFVAKSDFFDGLDAQAARLFLSGEEGYLSQLEVNGEEWIGKSLPIPLSIHDLEQIEKNIKSLASRLSPNWKGAPLFLHALGNGDVPA